MLFRSSKKHVVLPDPIYGSTVVAQLINKILLDGKKSIAEDIVYSALDMVKEKTEQEPVAVLKRALDNIRPSLEVRSRRVGGATYQVPVEVKPNRANTLSLRWLTDFSRARREKTMAPPTAPLRSGNISPCRAARCNREPAQACTLRTRDFSSIAAYSVSANLCKAG